jgi:hypothetical protein
MSGIGKRIGALEAKAGVGAVSPHVILWSALTGWAHALARHGRPILPGEAVLAVELVGVRPGHIGEETAVEAAKRAELADWMAERG